MTVSRWFLVWFAAALVVGTAGAADVLFSTTDLVGSAITSRPLRLVPIDTPRINGSAIVTGERYVTNTRAGSVTISNITAGYYRGEIAGTWTNTVFVLHVPDTNALYTAAELLVPPAAVPSGIGYTRAQVDALLAAQASTNSGASLSQATNAAKGVLIQSNYPSLIIVQGAASTNHANAAALAASEKSTNLYNATKEALVVTQHGVKGDGITNDAPAIQALWNAYPSFTTFLFPPGVYMIGSTITNPVGSTLSRFIGVGNGASQFWTRWYWSGPTNGTVNGAMLDLDSCNAPYFENIVFWTPHTNAVRKLVNIDLVKGGGSMTEWEFNRCHFVSDNADTSREQWLVMVSTNSVDGCEHGRWINCVWNAGGHGANFTNRTIGLFFGNNPNMLNLRVEGGEGKYCTNFLKSLNGSFTVDNMLLSWNAVDFAIDNPCEQVTLKRNRSERNRQFFVGKSGQPVAFIENSAYSHDQWETDYPLLQFTGLMRISRMEGNVFGSEIRPEFQTFGADGVSVDMALATGNRFSTNSVAQEFKKFQNGLGFGFDNTFGPFIGYDLYRVASAWPYPKRVLSFDTNLSDLRITIGDGDFTVNATNLFSTNIQFSAAGFLKAGPNQTLNVQIIGGARALSIGGSTDWAGVKLFRASEIVWASDNPDNSAGLLSLNKNPYTHNLRIGDGTSESPANRSLEVSNVYVGGDIFTSNAIYVGGTNLHTLAASATGGSGISTNDMLNSLTNGLLPTIRATNLEIANLYATNLVDSRGLTGAVDQVVSFSASGKVVFTNNLLINSLTVSNADETAAILTANFSDGVKVHGDVEVVGEYQGDGSGLTNLISHTTAASTNIAPSFNGTRQFHTITGGSVQFTNGIGSVGEITYRILGGTTLAFVGDAANWRWPQLSAAPTNAPAGKLVLLTLGAFGGSGTNVIGTIYTQP